MADRGLGRAVAGRHQRAGVLRAQRVEPQLGDPFGMRVAQGGLRGRALGQRLDPGAPFPRDAPQHGVDQPGAAG
jgi:hypothetical protein